MGKRKAQAQLKALPQRLALAIASCFGTAALALPIGPLVVNGSASISQTGNALTVTNSPGAILNWQSFNIGANELVRFQQASASSAVLNRVLASDPSVILGQLSSNGRVWLINPAGILVGPGARIDTAAFVASTLNITNADFLANKLKFEAALGAGNVVNQGSITTPLGGSVYLIGSKVSNDGIITTPKGETILAAGQTVELIDTATPGVKVEISGQEGNVTNLGRITAEAGRIGIAGALIKNAGTLNASSVENEGGRIFLRATKTIELTETSKVGADGTAGGHITVITTEHGEVTGELTANGAISAQGNGSKGSGGFVDTSAAKVRLQDGFSVKTNGGHWLLDPVDFTIAASGGDITGTALSSLLGSNNVTIRTMTGTNTGTNLYGTAGTNGDIFVNDTVTWSVNKLTLHADRNIEINTAMYGSGTASLALEYGQGAVASGNTATYKVNAPVNLPAGNYFSTQLGSDGSTVNYTVVTSLGVAGDATTTTLQGIKNNLAGNYVLGADIAASSTSAWNSGAGFTPISIYTGRFDGLGHTISGLTINRTTTDQNGLFGQTNGASIQNVGLLNASIIGSNSYPAEGGTGALVGRNQNTSITNSYSTGTVQATWNVGGLVGKNVTGGNIIGSYSTAVVSGSTVVGGLVGYATGGSVSKSYSTGSVTGTTTYQGGLVGYNMAAIDDSYSTATVNGGSNYIGGLVGRNEGGTITNTYATGTVSGAANVGRLAGENKAGSSITNSFWDTDTVGATSGATGIATNAGTLTNVAGKTSSEMRTQTTYTGASWDFANTWWMSNANTRPFLRSEWSSNITNAHQLQLMAMNLSASYTLANNIDMTSALAAVSGQYPGMWSSAGFVPIGISGSPFTGSLDGLGHTVNGLKINRSSTNVGLFGYTGAAAVIKNLGVTGVDFNSTSLEGYAMGGIVGINAGGSLANVYSTGTLTASNVKSVIGGLVGSLASGSISNSYSAANVTVNSGNGSGANAVGGLVGFTNAGSSISSSHSTGTVASNNSNSGDRIGGLVGDHRGTISNSYSTSSVQALNTGGADVGGLVGHNGNLGVVVTSYATGSATCTSPAYCSAGGLLGANGGNVSNAVSNSFSLASVSVGGAGTNYGGGLIGNNVSPVTTSFAAATVGCSSGTCYTGGLIGRNSSTATNSYWDATVAGALPAVGTVTGGTTTNVNGLVTAEMKSQTYFTPAGSSAGEWDFTNVWKIVEGSSYPYFSNAWKAATDGNWSTASNWSLGHAPLAGESIVIDKLGTTYTVTISSGANSAGTLISQNALSITGGSLTLGGSSILNGALTIGNNTTLNANGLLTLNGITLITGTLNLNTGTASLGAGTTDLVASGVIANGTITVADAAAFNAYGWLDSVTLSGKAMVPDGGTLYLQNNLTLDNGSITLASTGQGSYLVARGVQSIGGTGNLIFGGSSDSNLIQASAVGGNGSHLTLGANITVKNSTGSGLLGHALYGLAILGTVDASVAGQSITITGTDWTSSGTLKTSGGILNIAGKLDNSGRTWTINDSTGSPNLLGTVSGGNIAIAGAATLNTWGASAVLDGVSLSGNLTISDSSTLRIENGLTLANGSITLASTGQGSHLVARGVQTIGGSGELIFGGSAADSTIAASAVGGNGNHLTIGQNVTVRNGTGSGTLGHLLYDLTNLGMVDASTVGQSIDLIGNWTNAGTVKATAGSLTLGAGFVNSGTLQTGIGTISTNNASFTNASAGRITGTGTLDLGTGTLTNNGTIAPGTGAGGTGTLTINGNVNFSTGILEMDINAPSTGYYDKLVLTGTGVATLGGTLNINGTGPNGTYPLLTYASRSGTFATINQGSLTATPTYGTTNFSFAITAGGVFAWDGGGGTSSWTTATNWIGDVLPTANDNVYIASSAGTVTLDSGNQTVKALTCNANFILSTGGSLSIAEASSFNGSLTLSGGILTGAGNVTANGAFNVIATSILSGTGNFITAGTTTINDTTTVSQLKLIAKTWNNTGTLNIDGNDQIQFDSGASTLTNQAGGVININTSNQYPFDINTGAGATATFANAGTLNKISSDNQTMAAGLAFNNSGTVTLTNGILERWGTGTDSGIYNLNSGTQLKYHSGTYAINSGASFTGSGIVIVGGNTATVTLNAATSFPNLYLTNTGTVTGTVPLTVTSNFSNTGGTLSNTLTGLSITQVSGNLSPGDLNINGPIVLNAPSGTVTLGTMTTPSRWLVYAANPGSVIKNGLTSDFRHYGVTYANYASPTEAGNGILYASNAGSLTVATTGLAAGTAGHIYGDAPGAVWAYSLSGFADTEDNAGNIGLGGTASFTTPGQATLAGTYTPTIGYASGLTSVAGYGFVVGTGYATSYTVARRSLSVGFTAATKTYDGTTQTAVLPAPTFGNALGTDLTKLTLTGSGSYDTRHVGTGKTVSYTSLVLSGAAANNYILGNATVTGSGTITQLDRVAWTGTAGDGKWSTAGNWAGGALPDNNNVANVDIVATSLVRITDSVVLNLGNTTVHVSGQGGSLELDIIGGIRTGSGLLKVASGSLKLIAHSPITIGSGGLEASQGISLLATTPEGASTIQVDGPLTSASGPIAISAYSGITQNASLSGNSISLTSDTGNIVVASTAITSVATGGNINYVASKGSVTSSPANFAGTTPIVTTVSGTTGNTPPVTAEVQQTVTTALESATSLTTLTTQETTLPAKTEAPATSETLPVMVTTGGGSSQLQMASLNQTIGGTSGQFGAEAPAPAATTPTTTTSATTPTASTRATASEAKPQETAKTEKTVVAEEKGTRAESKPEGKSESKSETKSETKAEDKKEEKAETKKDEKKEDKKAKDEKDDSSGEKKPAGKTAQKKVAQCS